MAVITQAAALTRSNEIRTETTPLANTAQRVGSLLVDLTDSLYGSGSAGATGATGATGPTGPAGSSGYSSVITEATAARTGVLGDANALVRGTHASGLAYTIPPNSSVAFPIGNRVTNRGTLGAASFIAGAGVTVNTPGMLYSSGPLKTIWAEKVATDTWDIGGDLVCITGVALTDANQTLLLSGGDDYAQVVALTANRTKTLSTSGAAEGRVITIRRYTNAAFTLTITDSIGNALYQFASGQTGIVNLRYSAGLVNEWTLGSFKDLI